MNEAPTPPQSAAPQAVSPEPTAQDIEHILNSVTVAEATSRAAFKEIWDIKRRLKRTEASLALVLGSLVQFEDGRADYVLHRLAQELRRLAEIPDTAAELAGCADEDVDPDLLRTIAAHLAALRPDAEWRVQPPEVAMH